MPGWWGGERRHLVQSNPLCDGHRVKAVLEDLDISDEDQVDLFDTLDVDGGGTIDLNEMIVGISKLRGDARRSDIVGVGLVVRSIQVDLKRLTKSVASLRPL